MIGVRASPDPASMGTHDEKLWQFQRTWVLDKPGGVEAYGFLSRVSAEIPHFCHLSSLMAYELSFSPISSPSWVPAGERQMTNSTAAVLWSGLG